LQGGLFHIKRIRQLYFSVSDIGLNCGFLHIEHMQMVGCSKFSYARRAGILYVGQYRSFYVEAQFLLLHYQCCQCCIFLYCLHLVLGRHRIEIRVLYLPYVVCSLYYELYDLCFVDLLLYLRRELSSEGYVLPLDMPYLDASGMCERSPMTKNIKTKINCRHDCNNEECSLSGYDGVLWVLEEGITICPSETSVLTRTSQRHHIPEESIIHCYRCTNTKSFSTGTKRP
jgi:hypothetical protein